MLVQEKKIIHLCCGWCFFSLRNASLKQKKTRWSLVSNERLTFLVGCCKIPNSKSEFFSINKQ